MFLLRHCCYSNKDDEKEEDEEEDVTLCEQNCKLNIAPIREIIMKTQRFFWRESTYSVK